MAKHYAQMKDGRLVPFDQTTAEEWANFGQFEVVGVKVTRERNAKFNGLYRAFLGYVCKALTAGGDATTNEDLHQQIKYILGYYTITELNEETALATGQTHVLNWKSTSFNRMSEEDFAAFVLKAFNYVEEDLCPYLMDSDWAPQINNIIAEFRKFGG